MDDERWTKAHQSLALGTQSSIVADALAGLGATEDDRPLLDDVARAIAELGLAEDAEPHQL